MRKDLISILENGVGTQLEFYEKIQSDAGTSDGFTELDTEKDATFPDNRKCLLA